MIETFFMGIIMWVVGVLTMPLLFWPICILELWWLIGATEDESLGGAFFATTFITIMGILEFGSFSGFWHGIVNNPLLIGAGLFAFFCLGTMWARIKWGFFVSDFAATINDTIHRSGADDAAYEFSNSRITKKQILESSFACLAPKVGDYKHKIVTWIILWIPSFLWFLLNDPLRRIGNWIFDNIKGYFQSVSDAIFKKSFNVVSPLAVENVIELKKEDEVWER